MSGAAPDAHSSQSDTGQSSSDQQLSSQQQTSNKRARTAQTTVGGNRKKSRGLSSSNLGSKIKETSRKQFWLVFDDYAGNWDHHDTSSECVDTVVDALVLARRIAENMKCVNIFWSTKLFFSSDLCAPSFFLYFLFFLFFLLFLFFQRNDFNVRHYFKIDRRSTQLDFTIICQACQSSGW